MVLLCVLHAQKNSQDVIYLKSTSVIRGRIIQPATDSLVKIELAGGSIFVFSKQDIDSIKKENRYKNKLKGLEQPYFRKESGYRNITEASLLYGAKSVNNSGYYYSNNRDDVGISLHTVNGYQFDYYIFMGAGVGVDRFITYQQTFSPLYLRLASEFLQKKVTPYIYADVGYSLMWKEHSGDGITYTKSQGGLYINAGGGIRIYTLSRASVLVSAGYKYNNSETDWKYTGNDYYFYTIKRTYHRLVINLGVTF